MHLESKIKKIANQMMNTGIITLAIGWVGLILFLFDIITIHPVVSIVLIIMGNGWALTGSTIIKEEILK